MRNKAVLITLLVGILVILVPVGVNADIPEYVNDWVYEGAGTATCVVVSSNGNYITVGTPDGLYLLDGEANLLWSRQTDYPIINISMTADANYIIAAGSSGFYGGGIAYFFNRAGDSEGTLTMSTGISSVSFSPEGNYFAMTYDNGLGWNDRVALAGEGQWLWYQDFGRSGTAAVSISVEATYGAVGGAADVFGNDGGVILFNKTGDCLWDYAIDTTTLSGDKYSVSISSDGKYVVAGNQGNDNLYFFDRDQGFLWSYNIGLVKGVSISADGNYVIAASSGKVFLFDGYMNLHWMSEISNIKDVSMSGDANTIVVVTGDGKVYSFTPSSFSGVGSGTEEDPYIITNVYELQEMNNDLDVWYELGNDIDASNTRNWNEDPGNPGIYFGFVPIGAQNNAFHGHFDGKGHTITGLFINRPSTTFVGLFGKIELNTSEVKSVGLENISITGYYQVGGLAGSSEAFVSSCYSTGHVRGTYYVGGLIGVAQTNFLVTDCYSTASVDVFNNAAGGLIGATNGWNYVITNCYSVGNVSGIGRDVGGFVGEGAYGASNNCFWDIETSGQTVSACGTGKTTAEMKQQATFTNWDFDTVWDIIENEAYPFLQANSGFSQRFYAVIVGVGNYVDSGIEDLDYASDDARDIYSRLVNSGWIPGHMKLLTDSQATKANIQADIDWMRVGAGIDDVCLFFFSGYGTYSTDDLPPDVEADGHDEFICPVDTQVGSPETAIRDDEFAAWMDPILAQKVIILDACRSGGFINDFEQPGYVVLAACEEDRRSAEWPELEHGVFTYYILQGLRGPADGNRDGKISAEELFSYASPRVVEYMGERDQYQQPQLYDGIEGEAILVKYYSTRVFPYDAAELAKQVIGAPYLGDGETYGGKGLNCWSCAPQRFVDPDEIKTTGYCYYDGRIKTCNEEKAAGVDCSGLVFWAYNRAYFGNKELTGEDMKNAAIPFYCDGAGGQYEYSSYEIEREELLPGDLLFFVGHVAMYVGEDKVVHSEGVLFKEIVEENLETVLSRYRDYFKGFRRVKESEEPEILMMAKSPIDLIVIDPDGLTITKELWETRGMYYREYDEDVDGEPDDIVAIPKRKVGDYLIEVIPEPNVLPTDTYSLEATIDGQTMVLAQDVQIQDIPTEPYQFELKLNRSDFDTDGDVDLADLATLCLQWLEQDCNYPNWCEGTDLNYNGFVDFVDFAIFAESWLWEKIPADFDIDGDVDFADYAILANQWRQPPAFPSADIAPPPDGDGIVNFLDLALMAEHWLEGVDN